MGQLVTGATILKGSLVILGLLIMTLGRMSVWEKKAPWKGLRGLP